MFTINTYNKIGQAGLDMYNKDKYILHHRKSYFD